MNTSGKIVLGILAVLLIFIIGVEYKKYFLEKDFVFVAYVNCNTENEECFQYDCGDECGEAGPWKFYEGDPYKKLKLLASDAPACLEEMTCLDLTCADVNGACETIYCSEETVNVDTVDGGEYCSTSGIPEVEE